MVELFSAGVGAFQDSEILTFYLTGHSKHFFYQEFFSMFTLSETMFSLFWPKFEMFDTVFRGS